MLTNSVSHRRHLQTLPPPSTHGLSFFGCTNPCYYFLCLWRRLSSLFPSVPFPVTRLSLGGIFPFLVPFSWKKLKASSLTVTSMGLWPRSYLCCLHHLNSWGNLCSGTREFVQITAKSRYLTLITSLLGGLKGNSGELYIHTLHNNMNIWQSVDTGFTQNTFLHYSCIMDTCMSRRGCFMQQVEDAGEIEEQMLR